MGSVMPDMMGVRARPKEEEEDHAADTLDMPPGFRFHPTDAEIILSYLVRKFLDSLFSPIAIAEVDLNTCEPWDLPRRAKMGEKEWWFFWRRDRKYPTGTRTNRATEKGYWKATGKDKEIHKTKGCLVGMKKTLVFYLGRAPKGEKTNWVMHEYRLEGKTVHSLIPSCSTSPASKNDWVVCRVFHKNEPKKPAVDDDQTIISQSSSPLHAALPPLSDSSPLYDHPAHFLTPLPHLSAYPFDHIPPYPDTTYLGYPQFPDPAGYLLPKAAPANLRDKCKTELHPLPQPSVSRDSAPTIDNPGSSYDGPLADLTDYYFWSD